MCLKSNPTSLIPRFKSFPGLNNSLIVLFAAATRPRRPVLGRGRGVRGKRRRAFPSLLGGNSILYVGPSFSLRIGRSFGLSVKLKRSHVPTALRAMLWPHLKEIYATALHKSSGGKFYNFPQIC